MHSWTRVAKTRRRPVCSSIQRQNIKKYSKQLMTSPARSVSRAPLLKSHPPYYVVRRLEESPRKKFSILFKSVHSVHANAIDTYVGTYDAYVSKTVICVSSALGICKSVTNGSTKQTNKCWIVLLINDVLLLCLFNLIDAKQIGIFWSTHFAFCFGLNKDKEWKPRECFT